MMIYYRIIGKNLDTHQHYLFSQSKTTYYHIRLFNPDTLSYTSSLHTLIPGNYGTKNGRIL